MSSTARAPSVMGTNLCWCLLCCLFFVSPLCVFFFFLLFYKEKIYFFLLFSFNDVSPFLIGISANESKPKLGYHKHCISVIRFRSMKSISFKWMEINKSRFFFMHTFFVVVLHVHTLTNLKRQTYVGLWQFWNFCFFLCPNNFNQIKNAQFHIQKNVKMLRWIVIAHRPFRHMRKKEQTIFTTLSQQPTVGVDSFNSKVKTFIVVDAIVRFPANQLHKFTFNIILIFRLLFSIQFQIQWTIDFTHCICSHHTIHTHSRSGR